MLRIYARHVTPNRALFYNFIFFPVTRILNSMACTMRLATMRRLVCALSIIAQKGIQMGFATRYLSCSTCLFNRSFYKPRRCSHFVSRIEHPYLLLYRPRV